MDLVYIALFLLLFGVSLVLVLALEKLGDDT